MRGTALRLVLLVSCAHAMVHVYELALPSTEQRIADEFQTGTDTMGLLGNCWRLPFGLGALLAGWLADRYGSKPLLVTYLIGCATTALLAWAAPDLPLLFVAMIGMGSAASIYHPAGLAIISKTAPRDSLPLALGIHGVFGSVGIAAAPAVIALALGWGATWRECFLLLTVPGVALAMLLMVWLAENHRRPGPAGQQSPTAIEERPFDWTSFLLLTSAGALTGFVYAGFLQFLPRYLAAMTATAETTTLSDELSGTYRASFVLLIGVVGQLLAGWTARTRSLEGFLVFIMAAMVLPLAWMASATGVSRVVAAGLASLVIFMHQPIYNSLVAHYVPHDRRSLGYGFSNVLTFGFGSFGAGYAGVVLERHGEMATYMGLALFSALATGLVIVVWQRADGIRHRAA